MLYRIYDIYQHIDDTSSLNFMPISAVVIIVDGADYTLQLMKFSCVRELHEWYFSDSVLVWCSVILQNVAYLMWQTYT